MTARVFRLLGVGVLVSTAVIVLWAPIATADSGRPTNYESVIDSVSPPPPGVDVEVVANDAFLEVTAVPGTEVEIPGYDGEPYLRIRADGTVEENRRSPAGALNQTMQGDSRLSDRIDSRAAPEWSDTGAHGSVAWHDHRIHWMLDDAPEVGDGGRIQDWVVPMTVDGSPVEVKGHLSYRQDVLPWGVAIGVGAAALAWWLTRRGRWISTRRAPILTGAAGAVGLGLWLAEWTSAPSNGRPSAVAALLSGAAIALSLLAGLRPRTRSTAVLGSVALLAGWSVVHLSVFWKPMLPTPLPDWVDRVGTGFVVGVAVGVAVSVLGAASGGRDRAGRSAAPASLHSLGAPPPTD